MNKYEPDDASKQSYDIAVVPGDGIGPDVSTAAVQVLKHAIGSDVVPRERRSDRGR